MNLNQLRIFHAVAGVLSFTRASEELNLTQPGISKHIKELEEYYGTRLFDRLGRKVVLTEAGGILFRYTKDIFHLLDESNARIRDLQGLKGGSLGIGSDLSIGTYILPEILVKFRHKYPNVKIKIDISECRQVIDKVLNNALELGFVCRLENDRRLVANRFRTDPLVLIVSSKHRWTKNKKSLCLRELVTQPFVMAKQGSGTRDLLDDLLRKAGIVLQNTMELGNTEGIKKAVEADLGISIISKHVVQRELASGILKSLPLKGVNLKRNLYFIYHKDKYLSGAAKAFMTFFTGASEKGDVAQNLQI